MLEGFIKGFHWNDGPGCSGIEWFFKAGAVVGLKVFLVKVKVSNNS